MYYRDFIALGLLITIIISIIIFAFLTYHWGNQMQCLSFRVYKIGIAICMGG